jgi:hypothetical protein
MGWLNLPKPTTSLSALTAEKRWKVGKGVDVKKIRLSHVFNIDLIWEFFDFLLSRQHNHAYTQDHLHYVIFLNSLVNHEYSFVRAHPELSTLFGMKPMSRPKWIKFSEKIHQQLLQLCRDLRALKPVKQRSSDEPLIEIFEDDDPTAIFFEMLEDLTARVPAKAHPLSRSVHLRDIALFHLAMEQPLRARNLSELRLGSTLIRDAQSGKWRVLVAKKALKNHYSKHAQAIYQVLSEPASSAIDRYVEEGRPNLQFSKMTDLFLLSGPSGPKRMPECFGVPPKGVYWIVRRRTEEAFGLGSGPNVFRHLLATSMLKDHPGDYKGPAAKLSNSPAMIEANYDHLTHKDHLGRADKWYAEKQRKHAETRAKKPRRG